jgi:alanine racemase
MDLITVDVSAISETVAYPGVMATVIGPHRTVDTVAAEAGTIGYEILTSLGSRYKRSYLPASGA